MTMKVPFTLDVDPYLAMLAAPFEAATFATAEDRSRVLAALLTALWRPAITGSLPLVVIQGPPCSGKTTLASMLARVCGDAGRRCCQGTVSEQQAVMGTIEAMDMDQAMLVFDGVDGSFFVPVVEKIEPEGLVHVPVVVAVGTRVELSDADRRRAVIIRLNRIDDEARRRPGELSLVVGDRQGHQMTRAAMALGMAHVGAGRPGPMDGALPGTVGPDGWDATVRRFVRLVGLPDPLVYQAACDGELPVEAATTEEAAVEVPQQS